MAKTILILGASGSGKTTAAKTLDPKKTVIICPEKLEELPIKGSALNYKAILDKSGNLDMMKSNFFPINRMIQYDSSRHKLDPGINEALIFISDERPEISVVLIDTITYAMVRSVMAERNVKGYDKFTEFAGEFYDLMANIPLLRKNLTVIVTAHTEMDKDENGIMHESFKIPAGRFTREKIIPEGLFNVVLYAGSKEIDGKFIHYFDTVNNGKNTCKAPEEMFPARFIPNDYRFVLTCYYNYHYGKDIPEMPEEFALKNYDEPVITE